VFYCSRACALREQRGNNTHKQQRTIAFAKRSRDARDSRQTKTSRQHRRNSAMWDLPQTPEPPLLLRSTRPRRPEAKSSTALTGARLLHARWISVVSSHPQS